MRTAAENYKLGSRSRNVSCSEVALCRTKRNLLYKIKHLAVNFVIKIYCQEFIDARLNMVVP